MTILKDQSSHYSSTLSYLYSRLPMFTRVGVSAYKADLSNTVQFCDLLNNPQNKYKTIHVGGTNGKGSTSHMLAAILQTAGYKTGLYTSPHLRDFRERIRVNGKMISEDEVIRFVEEHKADIESIEPSFFEATVAMAFQYFAKEEVDIAVIEVGLGGRLDSTNIIHPILSVITNIGYDHMNILGNTLPEIASEKAGIIKSKTPVVIGQKQNEIADIFIQKSTETKSEIIFASEEWKIEKDLEIGDESQEIKRQNILHLHAQSINPSTFKSTQPIHKSQNPLIQIQLDLTGTYQLKNLATVLSSVKELRKQGYHITDEHIQTALKQVTNLTGLMGRWQTLSKNPLIICDTGHNEDGISEVLKNIENTPFEKLHMVIGMVKDKNIAKILELLPKQATYYFCEPEIPRAKPASELAAEGKEHGLEGKSYFSVKNALRAAIARASFKDLIFVGGSTFVVAEVV